MKTRLTLLLSACLFFFYSAQAQDDAASKSNTFKANPLGLIVGAGKINYERKINDGASAQLGVSFWSFGSDGSSISGLGLVPEYRFYTAQEALEGFYIAPFMKYNNYTVKDDDEGFKAAANVYRFGAKGGFQWLMGKKENFVIDLAFGGKYSDFNLKVKEGDDSDFENEDLFQGFSPELHFAIGFAF